MSEGIPLAERLRTIPGWPFSARARTVVIVVALLLLLGGYLIVELIALAGNLDDLLNDQDRE